MTPKQGAKKFYEWICQRATEHGQDPSIEVALWSPQETKDRGYGDGWTVCWEAGPWEWAISISLGSSLYCADLDDYGTRAEYNLMNDPGYWCEPYNGFILNFYKR